ncbi:MAG TPA: hypothetical protein VFE05_06205 [Longimicrobiaceae bacterium]|jgi:hypothetical protein|nr:hypothetical protein [Longimicrobiaceae bacterium]
MRITHHISLAVDAELELRFRALGLDVGQGFATFDVDEANPNWEAIARIVAEHLAVHLVFTTFTPAELRAAEFVKIGPDWHHGYPQPEDTYREVTYDLRDYCEQCGIGGVQKAPFRMKSEPKWGKRSLLQLNWVFDEYFVEPSAWETVLKPLGIETQPVLHHRTGKPLDTVLQLTIPKVADAGLKLGDHPHTWCTRCERKKYLPFTRGCFPSFASDSPSAPIAKTQEWFGSGASASRAVVISKSVYAALSSNRLRGCTYSPLCE